MKYKDLRDFIAQLTRSGDLRRITQPVSTALEMTEISDRVLRAQGPALLFENVMHEGRTALMPVLTNLFQGCGQHRSIDIYVIISRHEGRYLL